MEQNPWESLPEDILFDIFSTRLPAEVMRFCKCVCRTWRSFIKKQNLPTSRDTTAYMFSEGSQVHLYSFNGRENTLIEPKKLEFTEFRSLLSVCDYRRCLVGYSEGLACIIGLSEQDMDFGLFDDDGMPFYIVLWNPFINKIKIIMKDEISIGLEVALGFGFVPQTEDYKVVKLECGKAFLKVQIYSLISDSWKTVRTTIKCRIMKEQECQSPNAFVRGSAHWIARNEEGNQVILCFDMIKEEFHEISIPTFNSGARRNRVTSFRDTLALFAHMGFSGIDVWVMKDYGVADSWSRLYTFAPPPSYTISSYEIMSNEKILMREKDDEVIYYDPATENRKKLKLCFNK